MNRDEIIEQATNKIESVRELILMQDGEAVYDCNYRDLDDAHSLLEGLAGEPAKAEPVSLKVGEMPDRPITAVEYAHALANENAKLVKMLDAQAKEIERLTVCFGDMRVKHDFALKNLSKLEAENAALAERVEKLETLLGETKSFLLTVVIPMGVLKKGTEPNNLLNRIEQALQEGEKL